jgi:hypothetical protein
MALDGAVFNPAQVDPAFDTEVDAAWVDRSSAFRLGTGFHSATYADLGFQRGHYTRALWSPSGMTPAITFRYLGGIFADTAAAARAWQDALDTEAGEGIASSTCSDGARCAQMEYIRNNDGLEESYRAAQTGACLVETSATYSTAEGSALSSTIAGTQGAIEAAALRLPACSGAGSQPAAPVPPTPQPPATPQPSATPRPTLPAVTALSVTAVEVQATSGKGPALHTLTRGRTAYLAVYWTLRSGPAATATVRLTISHGKTVVFRATLRDTVDGPGQYDVHRQARFTMKAGRYRVTGTVEVNGVSAAASSGITIRRSS